MSIIDWTRGLPSRGEVRETASSKVEFQTVARVFRHGRDRNGVGWSSLDCRNAGERVMVSRDASSGVDAEIVRLPGVAEPRDTFCGVDASRGQSLRCRELSEGFTSFESALTAAYATRFLLICDVEGSFAGQAAYVDGNSLASAI